MTFTLQLLSLQHLILPPFFSVLKPYCESEDNVQCVPTSCDDHELSDDNHNNLGTSQVTDLKTNYSLVLLINFLFFSCRVRMTLKYQTHTAKHKVVQKAKESWQSLEKLENERAAITGLTVEHQMG